MTTDEKIDHVDAYLRRRYVERGEFLSDSDLLDALDEVAPYSHGDAIDETADLFTHATREAILAVIEPRFFEVA